MGEVMSSAILRGISDEMHRSDVGKVRAYRRPRGSSRRPRSGGALDMQKVQRKRPISYETKPSAHFLDSSSRDLHKMSESVRIHTHLLRDASSGAVGPVLGESRCWCRLRARPSLTF
jgi:hypothetical protein